MKIFLKVLVGIVGLVVLLAAVALLFFDPNDYKEQIIRQIEQQTGRTAAINKPLSLSLFPRLSITAGGLSLSNPESFTQPTMLSVGQVSLAVGLLPLLKGAIEIDSVTLDRANIDLEQLVDGSNNWDDLLDRFSSEEKEQKDEKSFNLSVRNIKVTNSKLIYRDAVKDKPTALEIKKLKTGGLGLGGRIPILLELSLDSSDLGRFALATSSKLEADFDRQKFELSDLKLELAPLDADEQKLKLKGDLLLDLQQQLARLNGLRLEGPHGAALVGDIHVEQFFSELPIVNGQLDISSLPIVQLAKTFGVKFPFVLGPNALKRLSGKLTFKSNKQGLHLSPLNLTLDDTHLQGQLVLTKQASQAPLDASFDLAIDQLNLDTYLPVTGGKQANAKSEQKKDKTQPSSVTILPKLNGKLTLGKLIVGGQVLSDIKIKVEQQQNEIRLDPLGLHFQDVPVSGHMALINPTGNLSYRGKLDIGAFNPRKLLKSFGIENLVLSDAKALTLAQGYSEIKGNLKTLTLSPLSLKLDNSNITGDLTLKNFVSPAYQFSLSVDAINVDRYLPPAQEKTAFLDRGLTTFLVRSAHAASDDAALAKTLKSLNLSGNLRIGSLLASGLKMRQFSGSINAGGGKLRLAPLAASLYQGQYAGNINLDSSGNRIDWSANESVSGIALGPFLKDLVGQARINGKAHLKAKVNGSGVTLDRMLATLDGNMSFQVVDGSIKGINLAQALREAKAKLKGQALADTGSKKTDFSELTGTATIKNGQVSNQDFKMKTPYVRVNGKGTVNLPASSTDYQVIAKVVNTAKGQGGFEFAELEGYEIPIRIRGPFDNLSYSLDLEALLKARVERELDEQKEKLKEKAQEKLKEKLEEDKGELIDKLGEQLGITQPAQPAPAPKQTPAQAKPKPATPSQSKSTPSQSTSPTEPKKSVEDKLKGELLKGLGF